MHVASKLGHLLWFPIGGPSHTYPGWRSYKSSAYSSCVGTLACAQVSGMRFTCPTQLSCDPTMCVPVLVVSVCPRMRALVIRSCRWTPMIDLGMLLELLERFHMATLGDSCLTAIQEDGKNNLILVDGRPVGLSWLLFWSPFLRRYGLSSCRMQSTRISYIAFLHRYLPTLGGICPVLNILMLQS